MARAAALRDYAGFVAALNERLRPLFLRIAWGPREDTGEVFVALVRTRGRRSLASPALTAGFGRSTMSPTKTQSCRRRTSPKSSPISGSWYASLPRAPSPVRCADPVPPCLLVYFAVRALFAAQLGAIMQDEGGVISSIDAINTVTEASKSKKELESFLRRFADDGWLMEPSKVRRASPAPS